MSRPDSEHADALIADQRDCAGLKPAPRTARVLMPDAPRAEQPADEEYLMPEWVTWAIAGLALIGFLALITVPAILGRPWWSG